MKKVVIPMILILILVLAAFTVRASDNDIPGYINNVISVLQDQYSGEIDQDELAQGALKGMMSKLDKYTTYYTTEEAESFLQAADSLYQGIGIDIAKIGQKAVVVAVFENTPAAQADIKVGDQILSINNKDMSGMSLENIVANIRGTVGDGLYMNILKKGYSEATSIKLVRSEIKQDTVKSLINNNIGYIYISSYASSTEESLKKVLSKFDENKITRVIMDLRNNPGGYVDEAVENAKHFVPAGLITKLDFRSEKQKDKEYYSDLRKRKYKLAVLVNGNTASAAEIFSGAVQDTNAGVLIGSKTFGKAKVQTMIPILTPEAYQKYKEVNSQITVNVNTLINEYGKVPSDKEVMGYIKLTTAYYTTPKGRHIDGVGLEPDIKIPDSVSAKGVNFTDVNKLGCKFEYSQNDQGADILNCKRILKILGYYYGTPDMILDKNATLALNKFATDNKIKASGSLSLPLQKILNSKYDIYVADNDKQLKKAIEALKN